MFIPKPFRAFAFITFLDPEVRRQLLSQNVICFSRLPNPCVEKTTL